MMTSEQLAVVAGMVLSLAFSYVPGLDTWYEGQNSQVKASIMALCLVLVAGAAYGLSCTGNFAYFQCSETGAWAAVEVFVLALAANQGTYLLARNLPGAE